MRNKSLFLQVLCLLGLLFFCVSAEAQLFPRTRRDTGPKPKNINGIVSDLRGTPLTGARVFLRNMKTSVIRTLETDQKGEYRVFGLAPDADYELYADFKGTSSDKKFVSSYLNRVDNVLNFQLDVAVIEEASNAAESDAMLKTFDLVELHASFEMPLGVPAPIPAVLLLHGYGEDRSVWKDFSKELLKRGWAVMALDLRGHGQSRMKNQLPIEASSEWRTSPHEFPVDLDPALDWLKSRPRLDNRKIVVIGFDVGANLALIASSRFQEVATSVALKPSFEESLALAGSAQDFHPRSSLIVAASAAEADRLKGAVKEKSRVVVVTPSGGTAQWTADKQIRDAIFQWLQETY